jgi:hypothetical protein
MKLFKAIVIIGVFTMAVASCEAGIGNNSAMAQTIETPTAN